jgi:hypothetical protein
MDKDGDLKNGVLIEMNKFNLIVMEVADEITGREYESSLEKGSHHHNFFILGWPPLNHNTVRKKVLFYEFQYFPLIDKGRLELLRVRGGHGAEKEI